MSPKPPKPVEGAKLTWRCRELVDRLSIWSLAIGVIAIVGIAGATVPWALDQIPRHGLRQDAGIELGVVIGLAVAGILVMRGIMGDTNLERLPRVDAKAGILFVESGAYRLADLGDITVGSNVESAGPHSKPSISGYLLMSSTVGKLAETPSVFGIGETERMAVALRKHMAARK